MGAQGVHTLRHLASWEDCESTQRFRRDSQEFRHPDGYRNGTKTSSNPKPCVPTIVRCAGGSLKQVHRNTHTHTHTHTKLIVGMKTFCFIVFTFSSNACFCCRECKGTKFLYILSPPHPHFPPPPPTLSSSKTLSFHDFHSPNLFSLKLFIC